MRVGGRHDLILAAACLLWLAGCETTSLNLPNPFRTAGSEGIAANPGESASAASAQAPGEPAETTGTVAPPVVADSAGVLPPAKALLGADPYDDLSLGKKMFRDGNFGLAERYFRRAVEAGPRDAEAWLGLAAAYDRLKRFDLADRAYSQVLHIAGRTPEVLNNLGYSYMLRGNYQRAREILREAQAKDPASPYIQTNLALLEESLRTRKAIR